MCSNVERRTGIGRPWHRASPLWAGRQRMRDGLTRAAIRNQIGSTNRRLVKNNAAASNTDRSLRGALAVVSFADVTELNRDVQTDPETVLSDLLADLMHWCDVQNTES